MDNAIAGVSIRINTHTYVAQQWAMDMEHNKNVCNEKKKQRDVNELQNQPFVRDPIICWN